MVLKSKFLYITLILIIITLNLSACLDFMAPGSQVEIYGFIKEEGTYQPIAGARISAGQEKTTTNEEGHFHLQVPYAFDLSISISAPGYHGVEIPLFMPPRGGEIEITRALRPILHLSSLQGSVSVEYRPPAGFYPGGQDTENQSNFQFPWEPPPIPGSEPAQILLRFNPGLSSQAIKTKTNKFNLENLGRIEGTQIHLVNGPGNMSMDELIEALQGEDGIELAEPNHPITTMHVPNDPYYSHQWNLTALRMEAGWQISKGNSSVVVAVLDTGFLLNHPDLRDNIVPGYDFIENNGQALDKSPHFSHGTHVAGIIAAVTDNNTGVAGIAPNVSLMPVRVMDEKGQGSYASLIQGIYFAADMGAQVINMSLGGPAPSAFLQEAIDYALSRGSLLIAAAGNDRGNVIYPAAYPDVVGVGAIGPNLHRSYYSNYGYEMDLVAPGGDSRYRNGLIISTAGRYVPETGREIHNYQGAQGTSMAAPHVAGVTALIISQGITDPDLVFQLLTRTTTPIAGPEISPEYGWGLLNAAAALEGERARPLIFPAIREGDELILQGSMVKAQEDGSFYLTDVKPGTVHIFGWIDNDGSGTISSGDIFGVYPFPVTIEENENISDLHFDLEIRLDSRTTLHISE